MKKKILFTIPNFNTAGSGKVVLDLIRGLKSEFEIEVACFNDSGALYKIVEAEGVKMHLFDFTELGKPYYNLHFRVKRIIRFFKENKFDLIHSWHYLDDWSEPLAARLAGVPFVFTKKSMSWDNRHWWFRSKLSKHIITINTDMNSEFYPKWKKAVYMPLGLDLKEYAPLPHSKKAIDDLNVSKSDFVLMSVANMVPVKGIETAIEALSLVDNENVKYVLVGSCEDAYSKKLLNLVSINGLEKQVFFVGKQTDVKPFLAAADLFVIPTKNEGRKEGQPMAPIEAMACQRLVAGSRIPGVKDILSDFPEFIFNPSSPEQLRDIIERVIAMSESERAENAAQMRKNVEQNYSIERFVTGHSELYKGLIRH